MSYISTGGGSLVRFLSGEELSVVNIAPAKRLA